jgi:hypothetical protein
MRNWNRKQVSSLILVLLCVLALSDCSSWNQKSSPPPNPISQPQEGSSPPPAMSSGPRPLVYDFPDVPVPQELTRQERRTFVIQSGNLKAGLLTLRGMRVDVRSLINFFQIAMPRENWKPKGGFHTKRTVLIFEKPDKTCVINLFETTLYTYAEIYVAPASGGPL